MYIAALVSGLVALVAALVALSSCRDYRRRLQDAQRELLVTQGALQASRFETATVRYRIQVYRYLNEKLGDQAARHDTREMFLLTEIGADALRLARSGTIVEAWKSYALAYEVFCEAIADDEEAGIENAMAALGAARDSLRILDEYDA